MRSAIVCSVSMCLLLVAAGCTASADSPDPGYAVSLETQPTPMQSGRAATVLVRIQQTDGTPLTGAKVVFKPEHSSMSMGGPPTISTREREPGVYAGDYLPVMSGKYRVTVEVEGAKGKGRKAFDTDVQ